MVQGFMDGYDLTAPEPSANRSASYRHGFMVGRIDKTPADWCKHSAAELERMADAAMNADDVIAIQ
jgi:hypothetical protein